MAIRINAGTPPQLGRITMPQGTYLSQTPFDNPAGQAVGELGGSQGTNVSMWGGYVPGTNALAANTVGASLVATPQINPLQQYHEAQRGNFGDTVVTGQKQNFYNELGQPVEYEQHHIWNGKDTITYNPVVHDSSGNRYTWDANKKDYVRDETGILNPKPSAPTNTLVGQNFVSAPAQMTAKQVQAVTGLTGQQLTDFMVKNGYGERRYMAGVGEVYVKTGEAAPSSQLQQGIDSRGRPDFVDGASLARGERVTNSRGFTYVGGTPYTDPSGNTVGQYAVTVPGVKNDPKGMFKWKERTQKDSNGNWVKIYSQEVRKVYSQRAERLREARADRAKKGRGGGNGGSQQQLVNLRVNYG